MTTVDPDEVRTRFSTALSAMYRREVPLYGDLLRIVSEVNARTDRRREPDEPRIALERHGAIRLGSPDEIAIIGRLFAVMGMSPVGYYDLAPAGIPVHSTAFRPTTEAALARNPFRMFTSLLRLELIEDAALRSEVQRLLAARQIVTPHALVLIEQAEAEGGLTSSAADDLIREALHTFRWNASAAVDRGTYERLLAAHPLIADVACFHGPHVNHLTPRTFDIDAVHAEMASAGMAPKAAIEGPPRRACPILLRQTSFKAREEQIDFGNRSGTHTARFGEVEQRGAALTPKGRAFYDSVLAAGGGQEFGRIPDDFDTLHRAGLVFARYRRSPTGQVTTEPITYEDFLPVSAAGIFKSNLAAANSATVATAPGSRTSLEATLGCPIQSEMSLYADIEARTREAAKSRSTA